MSITKSGFIALIGRPNVGKSTLLNALIGEKLSITSSKPQTTRWQILGIKTTANAQMIYVDTPGLHHEEKRAMNRYLNRVATGSFLDADVVVWVIDATDWRHEDEIVLKKLDQVTAPIVIALNKIDLLNDKSALLPMIAKLNEQIKSVAIIPISAASGLNIDALEIEIQKLLPEGPPLYPEDQITDKSIRFQLAEIIREKLINITQEEVPYATAVQIEQFKETDKLIEVSAIIWVERSGQKVIIIGKNGSGLKKVGTQARLEMEKRLGKKVFLRLWVKIKEQWTDDDKAMRGLGYE